LLYAPQIKALGDMERQKEYRRYALSWQEPPATSGAWVVKVTSDNRDLQEMIGKSSAVFCCQTRDDAIVDAKAFVDMLLGGL
jgi:hypothetical protein